MLTYRKRHAAGAPFVEYRAACKRRSGMCGYTADPEDGSTCYGFRYIVCCNNFMVMSVGTDLYPHMPILRPHAVFYERRISSVTFTSALYLYGNVYMRVDVARALAGSSDFGLLGSKVYKNGRFHTFDADEPPSKI